MLEPTATLTYHWLAVVSQSNILPWGELVGSISAYCSEVDGEPLTYNGTYILSFTVEPSLSLFLPPTVNLPALVVNDPPIVNVQGRPIALG